ncbi:hypothetical protein OIO90_005990 [Microbotryomycetes sp. JL221]|nr:hypothetical protein OIO90_005990 [Microbotryomycetes sp. JL221]
MHASFWSIAATTLLAAQAALALPTAEEQAPRRIIKRSDTAGSKHRSCPSLKGPVSDTSAQAKQAFPQAQAATTTCPVYTEQRIRVPTYIWVPYYSAKGEKLRENGYISKTDLLASINRLNTHNKQYLPRLQYDVKNITWYPVKSATTWNKYFDHDPDSSDEMPAIDKIVSIPARGAFSKRPKTQMQQLWIYVMPNLGGTTSGFSFTPEDNIPFSYDGVYINGNLWEEETTTLTHEVGHWTSLQHTFEGGCKGTDGVSDTPPWANLDDDRTRLCSGLEGYSYATLRNPCGGTKAQAAENIKNFMSYSEEYCQNKFTT